MALNIRERILFMINGTGWGPERIWIGLPKRNMQNEMRKIVKYFVELDLDSSIKIK